MPAKGTVPVKRRNSTSLLWDPSDGKGPLSGGRKQQMQGSFGLVAWQHVCVFSEPTHRISIIKNHWTWPYRIWTYQPLETTSICLHLVLETQSFHWFKKECSSPTEWLLNTEINLEFKWYLGLISSFLQEFVCSLLQTQKNPTN